MLPKPYAHVAATLVAGGAFACAAGLALHGTAAALPWAHLRDTIALAFVAVLPALAVARLAQVQVASVLALGWLVALGSFAGVAAVLSVALLGAAAVAIGSLFGGGARGQPVLALALGLVVIGGVLGWTLRWPIHHAWVHAPLLLAACVLRRTALRDAWSTACAGWRRAVDADPRGAAIALLALGLASVGTWLPTLQADDLAYHLALPTQLWRDASYAPDPAQQIWALAPWLGDVLQGVAQVVAGREARGAVDALWLCVAAAACGVLARRLGADARTAWLAVALFASQPLLLWLLGGMQTELPACALLLVLAALIVDDVRDRSRAGAVLLAGLVALKLSSAISALVLLAWAVVRARGRLPWWRLPVAVALFAVFAGSSYVFAWRLGDNPLLPLFNHVFRSPLLPPEQLADPRWHTGLGPTLPWRITFDTPRYGELLRGGYGFVPVMLAGAWAVALWRRRTRGAALVATVAILLALWPMQYARYAFPALVLLLPALAVATSAALGVRAATLLLCALCGLDFAFQANANWIVHGAGLRELVRSRGDPLPLYEHFAPERALASRLRELDDGPSIVLALDGRSPYLAELAPRLRTVSGYAPRLLAASRAADADPSGARWQALLRELDARWVVLRPALLGDAQRRALAALGTTPVARVGELELWSVGTAPEGDAR